LADVKKKQENEPNSPLFADASRSGLSWTVRAIIANMCVAVLRQSQHGGM